jgi:FG-GAP-like repeat
MASAEGPAASMTGMVIWLVAALVTLMRWLARASLAVSGWSIQRLAMRVGAMTLRPVAAFFVRVGAVLVGVAGLVAGVVPGGSLASDVVPQWGPAVLVGHVPVAGVWGVGPIAVADFNGDGHEDVLIARSSPDAQHTFPVTILLGDGKGHFTDGTSSIFAGDVPRTQVPRQIVIADFNGDHRPDVFVADHGDDHDPWPGYQNTLILSAPGGKLVDATANLPQVYDFTHSAAAADVNGDGTTDLYIGNIGGANNVPPRILLNDGTGHFTVADGLLPGLVTDLSLNTYTGSAFADVNGDGHPDLVLSANTDTPQSLVLLNDGTGHFSELPGALPAKPFGPDAIGLDPTPLDINGDGRPDLVIGFTKGNPFYVGRWIQVLINNGDGTFRDETATRLPQSDNSDGWPVFFQPRDLEHNGRIGFGLQTSGVGSGAPLLYLLDKNGDFQPGPPVGFGVSAWAFIDAKGDGSNDIVGVTGSGDVLLSSEFRQTNTTPPPKANPPTLSHLQLTPISFQAARSGASIARATIGTTLSYQDSEIATTTFRFDRALPGVMRGSSCVSPSRHPTPGRQHCKRYVPLSGSFTHPDNTGANHFRFTGRIGGKTLRPGNYRLNATPRNAAGDLGRTVHSPFSILPWTTVPLPTRATLLALDLM